METNSLISIAIPVYEMHGKGQEFLNFSLTKISEQTYDNIQVVISDHSLNNEIKNLCNEWSKKLTIKYIKNENDRGSSSCNINNAINHSDGYLVKILFQDDFLSDEKSIEEIANSFDDLDHWHITACTHTQDGIGYYNNFYPKWNSKIINGINTISSPSVLTIRKNTLERFNKDLIWLMDCDFYMQLFLKYGPPKIHNKICVVNRIWGNRLSDTISQIIKKREQLYLAKKYKKIHISEFTNYFITYLLQNLRSLIKSKSIAK